MLLSRYTASRTARFAINVALSALALASSGAFAQQADDDTDSNQAIVVTGSRIVRDGFESPSPVTVVGQGQVLARAQTNIGEALNELPSFRALITPATQQAQGGNIGARILDLRALGSARTLVLLDGKRFVPSTLQGTIDVNLMPTMLIERTEVVTGGASAAYGSDAVAGVVNFIVDKKFTGIKATAQMGISQRGDGKEYNLGAAYGTGFGDGRGHFVASIEYNETKGMGDCYTRSWCPLEQLLSNSPAGTEGLPANMRVGPNSLGNQAIGGLINVPTGPLHGITFNADGTPRPFGYGRIFGTNPSPLLMLGGEGSTAQGFIVGILLAPPVTIVNRCSSGATEFCPYVTRNAGGFVTEVRDVLNNVNQQKVRGLDIEASYRAELSAGTQLGLRLLATRYLELSTRDSIGVTDRAGQTGYRGGATPGVPDWIVDGNIDLSFNKVRLGAHGHFIPKGKFDVLLVGPEDAGYSITRPDSVNTNRINSRFYLDLSGTVKINEQFEVFGVINNVLDKDPPRAFSSQGGTNHVWFDTLGRYFKVGVRVTM